MRLTCPNCGAQYEVPNEVIPTEGRDVQCSNCGNTWFQDNPDARAPDAKKAEPDEEELLSALRDLGEKPAKAAAPPPPPEPEQPVDQKKPEPTRRQLDPDVADILQQEAQRETEIRSTEASAGIESQPDLGLDDLGLDDHPDDATRRASQARVRMARIRGEDPDITAAVSATVAAAAAQPAEPASRREMLPDIEEINSTLRSSGDRSAPAQAVGRPVDQEPKRKPGFARGFSISLLIVAILVLIYANAPLIARTMPQADPLLSAFVALVDQGRLWLDTKISAFMP
jgi:predicted Zn finger-like uncharacterized protein